jgi:hypothetical protein
VGLCVKEEWLRQLKAARDPGPGGQAPGDRPAQTLGKEHPDRPAGDGMARSRATDADTLAAGVPPRVDGGG